MKIKKLGHCCLLITLNGKTILTDPGTYSTTQNEITGIDIIAITHEHPDHLHTESLLAILKNNPNAQIVTNTSVQKLLSSENISAQIIEDAQTDEVLGITFAGYGNFHADIYDTVEPVQNTGYLIDNKLFYPGDSLTIPGVPVDVLALPVAGPWLTIRDAVEYAIAIKPRAAFPVHDGMIYPDRPGPIYRLPAAVLPTQRIEFVVMNNNEEREF